MRRLVVAVAACAAALGTIAVASAEPTAAPSTAVRFPADYDGDIYVGEAKVWPTAPPESTAPATTAAPTTSEATTTTTQPSTTSSTAPADTSTTTTMDMPTSTTSPPASTPGCANGVAFCEDFADSAAFADRFDHGWSGELHAGGVFHEDRGGWPGDHDGMCGNPNLTHRTITVGGGDWDLGQDHQAAADPAFYACLPGNDPGKGHLMTSINTEGYVIAWFSPKPTFVNVTRVCFDVNLTYLGNGQWFQLLFLNAAEVAHKPVHDGQTMNVLDLGYTSPEYRGDNGLPTSLQGVAKAGVKFGLFGDTQTRSDLKIRPWSNGDFTADTTGGPSTADHAARYPICVADNGNGTLTITNGSPDGTTHTNLVAGQIPDGPIRVVFEHDEYNPDKHHSNIGPVDPNMGEGYTWHWDNVLVSTN